MPKEVTARRVTNLTRLPLIPLLCLILCSCSNNPALHSLAPDSPSGINGASPRSEEAIQLAFQRYKGAITQMYQRARREDPTLKGKVVFEITIEPSGAVSACKVLSSEMNAPDLLGKVVVTIKSISFGAKDVPAMTINFPFEFIPTDRIKSG